MRNIRRKHRRQSGVTNIVEFGPTMWIVFIMFTFPLLTFGTMGLRYCFVNNAVCYAAEAAAQCNTFSVAQDGTHPSAVTLAGTIMGIAAADWSGISLTGPAVVSIVISPLDGTAATSQITPLTTAQQLLEAKNVYFVQVTQGVKIQPLFPLTQGNVPGLNAPLVTSVTHSKYFEAPGGLGT